MTDHPSALVSVPEADWRHVIGALKNAKARLPMGAAISNVSDALAKVEHLTAAPQAAGVGEDDGARLLWNRFAVAHHESWDDEPNKAEYRQAAADVLALRAPSREPEGGAVDERLKWFLKVIEGAGGEVCSTESRHNPINVFCEDRDKGDDTFNISEAAGYTQTSHDTSFDTSTTRITDKGRTYLAAVATREEAPDWTARSEAAWAENNCEEAHDELLSNPQQLEATTEAIKSACVAWHKARDEEPFNVLYQGAWCGSFPHQIGPERWTFTVPAMEKAIAAYLRAQPQARRDAQPVAWMRLLAGQVTDLTCIKREGYLPLYFHPAPDALRAAVEALEKIKDYRVVAASATIWTGSQACRDIASQALAALQAEQGAK